MSASRFRLCTSTPSTYFSFSNFHYTFECLSTSSTSSSSSSSPLFFSNVKLCEIDINDPYNFYCVCANAVSHTAACDVIKIKQSKQHKFKESIEASVVRVCHTVSRRVATVTGRWEWEPTARPYAFSVFDPRVSTNFGWICFRVNRVCEPQPENCVMFS